MSRRRTIREIEHPPAQADYTDAVADHYEAAGIPIWFATRMPEPWDGYFWYQWGSAWAELSLKVCEQVWRRQGAKLYATHRDKLLREDLHDWLIVAGVESMADFLPDPWHPAPEKNWAAWLHGRLTLMARWHFGGVVGRIQTPSGRAAVDIYNSVIGSTDLLDEMEAETGYTANRHALHGHQLEYGDPAKVLIRIEELREQVEQVEREDRRAGAYSTSSTDVGQPCLSVGCEQPSIARGLCKSHYNKERRLTSPTCTVDGCSARTQAKGLCSKHYTEHRQAAVEDGTWQAYGTPEACSTEGCQEEHHARGLCRRHYEATRTRPPCKVEGCTLVSTRRAMCSTHYRRWRRSTEVEGQVRT